MAFNFPSPPLTVGQISNGYIWDGEKWNVIDEDEGGGIFLQGGTGAIERTAQDKMREAVSLADFGGDPTGATSNTAAFNAAVAYLASVGGGTLYFGRGRFVFATAPALLPHNLRIIGDGYQTTKVEVQFATGNLFHWPASGATVIASYEVAHLTITSSVARTSGAYIRNETDTSPLTHSHFHDLYLHKAYIGIVIGGGVAEIGSVNVYSLTGGATAAGGCAFYIDNLNETFIHNCHVVGDEHTWDGQPRTYPSYGIVVAETGGLQIESIDIISCGTSLFVNPAGGKIAWFGVVANSWFDSPGSNNVVFQPFGTTNGRISDWRFIGCMFSSPPSFNVVAMMDGGATGNFSGIHFNGCIFIGGAPYSVLVNDARITDVTLHACTIVATPVGFFAVAGVSDFRITNNTFGPSAGFSGNATDIKLGGGAMQRFVIANNSLQGSTAKITFDTPITGTTGIIHDNTGYSPAWTTVVLGPPDLAPGANPPFGAGATATVAYTIRGKTVDFRTQINIPTNNAGSSAINLTLPAVLSGMRGCANGRKINVGRSVMGSMFGGVMSIVHYDNTYPGGDGTDITMSGVFELP